MVAVSTWVKVASVATAVGGLGAMLSAIFSYLSARRSGRAAQDAKDALAASLRPHVHLRFDQSIGGDGRPGAVVVRAVVVGPLSPAGLGAVLPAADVRVDLNLASGRQRSGFTAVLEPNTSIYAQQPPYVSVDVREPSSDWPRMDGGDLLTATVTFSDARRVATYRRSGSVELWRSEPGSDSVSFREVTEGEVARIA